MHDDEAVMNYCLIMLMGVPNVHWNDPSLAPDVKLALDYAGVGGFYNHFVGLTVKDIESLTLPDGVRQRPLSTVIR